MKKLLLVLAMFITASGAQAANICDSMVTSEQAAECIEWKFENKVAKLQRKVSRLKAELKRELSDEAASKCE